jgi:hypothetical protein
VKLIRFRVFVLVSATLRSGFDAAFQQIPELIELTDSPLEGLIELHAKSQTAYCRQRRFAS